MPRGGQGAVTAAAVLVSALAMEGKYAQAFPFFGGERRGAPVKAFLRIDEKPIMTQGPDFQTGLYYRARLKTTGNQ